MFEANKTLPYGPTAVDDAATTPQAVPVDIPVLSNDILGTTTQIDNFSDGSSANTTATNPLLSLTVAVGPAHGTVVANLATGTITYTPNGLFYGTDSFSYTIADSVNSSSATVSVTVSPVSPVAQPDSAQVECAQSVDIDVLVNDVAGPGGLVTVTVIAFPNAGTASVTAASHLVYAAPATFNGLASFTYRVCDASSPALCARALVQVAIRARPPTAHAVRATIDQDQTVTMPVFSTVTQGCSPLSLASLILTSQPSAGSATVNTNGSVTYAPATGYYGSDTFEYEVCDTAGPTPQCSSASIAVIVKPVGPTAVADQASTHYYTNVSVNALSNDKAGAQPIQASGVTFVADPSLVTYDGLGTFTYSPPLGFSGVFSFPYTVCDNSHPSKLCSTTTVSISVTAPCPPSPPLNAAQQTPETQPVSYQTLFAPCQWPLVSSTLTVTSFPAHGVTSVDWTTGLITYTPTGFYYGPDSYTYQQCDEAQLCSSASVAITVLPVGPTAVADASFVAYLATVDIDVLANDQAGPAGLLTLTIVTAPSTVQGTATVTAANRISFTASQNFDGTASFEYQICDGSTPLPLCSTALVQVAVISEPCIAAPDEGQVFENGGPIIISVLANDLAAAGSELNTSSVMLTSSFSHGAGSMNSDSTVSYQPSTAYYGTDSATYRVCGVNTLTPLCCSATITITIKGVGPTAVNDTASTLYLIPVSVNVLSNDQAGVQPILVGSVTSNANQSLVVYNGAGTFTYSPPAGFSGPYSFNYTECDNSQPSSLCSTATVTITVGAPQPPTALSLTVTTPENQALTTPVLSYDTPGATPLVNSTLVLTAAPLYGAVAVSTATGSIAYTPSPNFYGTDSYSYEVCDQQQLCARATITVIVTPVGPDAVPDSALVLQNGSVEIAVLANDIPGAAGLVTLSVFAASADGTTTVLANNSLLFTPAVNFGGTATLSYQICDASVTVDAANVGHTISQPLCSTALVQVITLSTKPTAVPITASVDENGAAITISVVTSDVAGSAPIDPASLVLTSSFSHGTATLNADGTISYSPAPAYHGTDTATYRVCDLSHPLALCSNSASITVTINPVGPTAHDVSATTAYLTPVTVNVLGNVTPGVQPVQANSVTLLSLPTAAGGLAIVNSDGSITYSPGPGFVGSDSLLFQVCDNSVPTTLCSSAHVTIVVVGIGPGGWVLRYRLTAINYDLIQKIISVTVQTQTPAGTKMNNVQLWNGAAASHGLALVQSGPTTGPACDADSPRGVCNQYHVINFFDKPCNISGAELVLNATFLCNNSRPASQCGYINYPTNGVFRLRGLLVDYDACARTVQFGVDTSKSSLRLYSDQLRQSTVIAPVQQLSMLYGRLAVYPSNGATFATVELATLILMQAGALAPTSLGNMLLNFDLTMFTPLVSVTPNSAIFDFNLFMNPGLFQAASAYFLSATVNLQFGNVKLKRSLLLPITAGGNHSLRAQHAVAGGHSAARAPTTTGISSQTWRLQAASLVGGSTISTSGTKTSAGPTTAAPSDSSTSTALPIAIGVAVGVVVLVVLVVVFVLLAVRRRRRREDEEDESAEQQTPCEPTNIDLLATNESDVSFFHRPVDYRPSDYVPAVTHQLLAADVARPADDVGGLL